MDERLERAYFEYEPEGDISAERGNRIAGAGGNKIAEDVFKRCGYDFNKLHKWVMMHRLSHLAEKMFRQE
ncbi:hypothetical protein KAT24_00495 [Candidatus Pacearchaeota archaeon]|nr:hypothetical protein [Candidatus Pacearchaeota archaeon]